MSGNNGEQQLKDITDPNDTDVLCGRGGAALRHPGNQTYRRLVNLNKGLYITCMKTEKLKISKSIVAAIREQNGRFLEKDADSSTWFDIGEKKAIEKTSQALREGQPKLRQQIVQMGGGAQGTQKLMEQQFGANGIYTGAPASSTQQPVQQPFNPHAVRMHMMSQSSLSSNSLASNISFGRMHQDVMASPSGMSHSSVKMGTPHSRHELLSEMEKLSVHGDDDNHDNNPGSGSGRGLRPSFVKRLSNSGSNLSIDLGIQSSQYSLNSDYNSVATGGVFSVTSSAPYNGSFYSMDTTSSKLSRSQVHQNQDFMGASQQEIDRRNLFAKMKFNRPPSDRFQNSSSGHSMRNDGMPDFHMIGSGLSIYSNPSSVGSNVPPPVHSSSLDPRVGQTFPPLPAMGGADVARGPPAHGPAHVPAHQTSKNMLNASKHSMMSLSRISDNGDEDVDNSDGNSLFSDLSKQIGHVSTRSMGATVISEFTFIPEGDFRRQNDDGSDSDENSFAEVGNSESKTKSRSSGNSIMQMDHL